MRRASAHGRAAGAERGLCGPRGRSLYIFRRQRALRRAPSRRRRPSPSRRRVGRGRNAGGIVPFLQVAPTCRSGRLAGAWRARGQTQPHASSSAISCQAGAACGQFERRAGTVMGGPGLETAKCQEELLFDPHGRRVFGTGVCHSCGLRRAGRERQANVHSERNPERVTRVRRLHAYYRS